MKSKYFLLTSTLVILFNLCTAQVLNYKCESNSDYITTGAGVSVNGWGHTPKRNLHVLLIFVTFIEDDNLPGNDVLSPIWQKNSIPNYAQADWYGNSDMFDIDYQNPSLQNVHQLSLTKWYKEMSGFVPYTPTQGNGFSVTAKVFHVQISKALTFPNQDKGRYLEREYSNRAISALATDPAYSNEDWSAFDQRTNNPQFTSDNSQSNPDGIIDYVAIQFRLTPDDLHANGVFVSYAGHASINMFDNLYPVQSISNSHGTFSFNQGHTLLYGIDEVNYRIYFLHEFSHCLFNCPHYMGANSATGNYFYCYNGWGMMAGQNSWFQTVNSWERRYLGWVEPITITKQNISTSGIYELRDFVTTGDAIRIEIPGTANIPGNSIFPNYLYLENHQMLSAFDQKMHFNSESPMLPGIYSFESKADFENGISLADWKNRTKLTIFSGVNGPPSPVEIDHPIPE